MSSLLDMNREEKAEYVIRLYKEGKTVREIAEQVHMSFRNIGTITNRLKSDVEGQRGQVEDDDDIKSKSKITQAIALFSELKTPVEVAIALDLPSDQVLTIYREYWELEGMYGLAQIYEEAKYDLHDLLRLHKIVKDLGMEKQDIINVLDLVKNDQLQILQLKAQHLRDEINMLEMEKTKTMSHIFKLKRRIGESEETLTQKRGEMAYLKRQSRKLQQRLIDYNTDNLSPIAPSEW